MMVIGGFHMLRKFNEVIIRHIGFILIAQTLLFTVFGCGFKSGRMPQSEVVETLLKSQIESKVDILKLLGKPRGYGMSRFPLAYENPYNIWFYEYQKNTLSGKGDLKMLLVFFDREKYAGHVWFHADYHLKSK